MILSKIVRKSDWFNKLNKLALKWHFIKNINVTTYRCCLYLYTLFIGHKSCNMLGILNKLTLQKKLQNFVTNNVFWDKKSRNTTITKKEIKHENPCRSRGLNPGPLAPNADALPTPSQMRVTIAGKLFNCFDAMDQNVNKQSWICWPHIFNKFIFSVIFLHALITIFGSFSYVRE